MIESLKKITGPKYYEIEKYLDFVIDLLVENFGSEDVIMQFM
jgi:hypothetical protein